MAKEKEKESLGRRSARTFSVLTVGRVVGLIISVLSIILIARLLGPVDYGVFTLAYAFFLLVSATQNFGFGIYLTKYLSETQDKNDRAGFARALSAGYLSVIIIGLLLTLLGIGLSGFVASLLQARGVTVSILVLASSTIFFAMLYGTSDYALIGVGKNAMAVSLEIFENIVLLVVSVGLIAMGYGASGAIVGLLTSYVVAAGIGTCLVFRFAHKSMKASVSWPSVKEIKGAFGFALPIAAYNFLSNGVTNFGTLFLGFFALTSVIGNYGIANRSSSVFNLFYTTTAITLLPTLTIAISRIGKRMRTQRIQDAYNKTLAYSLIATVPLISYVGVFSMPLTYISITHSFGSAPLYLSLMAFGTMIGLPGIYAMNLFLARNKTSKLLTYGVIYFLAQFISVLVLVPLLGPIGAIVALFFVDGITCSYIFLRGTRTTLGIKTDYNWLLRVFAANVLLIAAFALGLLLPNFFAQLVYGLIAALVAYPFFLILLRAMGKEDVQLLDKAVEKLPPLRLLFNPLFPYLTFLLRYLQ